MKKNLKKAATLILWSLLFGGLYKKNDQLGYNYTTLGRDMSYFLR
jgi:hypothetical protein